MLTDLKSLLNITLKSVTQTFRPERLKKKISIEPSLKFFQKRLKSKITQKLHMEQGSSHDRKKKKA